LRSFFTDNVNSILGAVSLHLLVAVIFLWFKLGEVKEDQKEQVMIEFNEEVKPEEDKAEKLKKEAAGEEIPQLSAREVHSIASNIQGKIADEISTEKYEKEVLKELGISTLKTQAPPIPEDVSDDENAIGKTAADKETEKEPYVPNVLRKENTTVSYFLENRWHSYVYIPTYKCQGGGTVIIDIVINQSGNVISAVIAENKSTHDACLLEEAYHSALTARFNADSKAPTKQIGSITYVFLAQ
jgi:hypothetical protein